MTQENNINIAEILKDCPKGMELDCTKYSNVCFVGIGNDKKEPKIKLKIETFGTWCSELTLDKYGKESSHPNAKCLIFPKGKTTWEGFQRPFKDGDIINIITENNNEYITIFKDNTDKGIETYIDISIGNFKCSLLDSLFHTDNIKYQRLATEKEKETLFKTIKDNGYKWNTETKTLEKLVIPKFKVGDVIQDIDTYKVKITEVSIEDECYEYKSMDIKGIGSIGFSEQDNWELVPNKFDITTLKPFDKVLVRCNSLEKWHIDFFEVFNGKNKYSFTCLHNNRYNECIPYEGNEHLLGTTDDCDKFYKTW